MHLRRPLTLLLTLSSALLGCGDRSAPPARSSPPLESSGIAATPGVIDDLRPDRPFHDAATDRIVRVRGGALEIVQDVPVRDGGAEIEALRVFDDGSFVFADADGIHVVSAAGARSELAFDLSEVSVDGESSTDFWVGGWALGTSIPELPNDYGACHVVDGAIDRCLEFPNEGGYESYMALGDDGSIYMTDRDVALYRRVLAESEPVEVARFSGSVTGLRRSGSSLIAIVYNGGAYAIEGATARQITEEAFPMDLVGTSGDFYYGAWDAEYVQVDPECEPGWFSSCDTEALWHQLVVWRVQNGARSEIGHLNCSDAEPAGCDFAPSALGLDGASLFVIGDPVLVPGND